MVTKDLSLIKYVFENRENYPVPRVLARASTYVMGTSMFSTEVTIRCFFLLKLMSLLQGEVWKRKHQMLQPLLRQKMLEKHGDVAHGKVFKLLDRIESEVGSVGSSKSIQMIPYLKRLTIDVIGEVAFGAFSYLHLNCDAILNLELTNLTLPGTDFGAIDDRVVAKNYTLPQILEMMVSRLPVCFSVINISPSIA